MDDLLLFGSGGAGVFAEATGTVRVDLSVLEDMRGV